MELKSSLETIIGLTEKNKQKWTDGIYFGFWKMISLQPFMAFWYMYHLRKHRFSTTNTQLEIQITVMLYQYVLRVILLVIRIWHFEMHYFSIVWNMFSSKPCMEFCYAYHLHIHCFSTINTQLLYTLKLYVIFILSRSDTAYNSYLAFWYAIFLNSVNTLSCMNYSLRVYAEHTCTISTKIDINYFWIILQMTSTTTYLQKILEL